MAYSVRKLWLVMTNITFIILLGFHGRSEGCLREEKEALLRVKEAFNYPNGNSLPSWSNLTSTNFSSDCCTWEAVECDNSTNRVTSLFLNNTRAYELRDIKWSLNASSFLPFQQLQELDLQENYLSGLFGTIKLANLELLDLQVNLLTRLPSFDISHSNNLNTLRLSLNLLEGSIPESIMSLTSLTVLLLAGNNLNGSLPQQGGLCNLKNLLVLDLAGNKFEGRLPACLSNLTSLRSFTLQENGFEGIFPSSLFPALRSLVEIQVSDDHFSGSFSLSSLASLSNLKILSIKCYNTNLKLETENPPFTPSFQLRIFDIFNCTTLNEANNNKVPTFLLHQYDLLLLGLLQSNISGTFPSWILTNSTKLNYFNLSHNLFTGPFELNSIPELPQLEFFDISSNPIHDEIPSHIGFIFPNLISLDMSSTSLQGFIPTSIGEMRHLNELDLSNNNLSGNLPQEFGQGDNELRFLKLSDNNLNGPCLPIGSNLMNLLFMDLSNNNFKGKIQGGINNSVELRTLDLSANHLSGEIPNWIGNFQNLSYLILKENKLKGSIPIDLCELKMISILDLSHNKLLGKIPNCLDNITFGRRDALGETKIGKFIVSWTTKAAVFYVDMPTGKISIHQDQNEDVPLYRDQEVSFTSKRRYECYRGSILDFMSGLDVSENQLTGEIPSQIGYLNNIHTLNLSNNHLKGPIPETFSNLKQIESLDISHNKLTGHIPAQLTQLYSLSVFSVAHNNLSGMTPDMKNQFATFGSSSYEGNPFLCGPPLQQNCSSIDQPISAGRNKQPYHLEADDFQDAFLWSFGGAFGVFFLGIIAVLYLNPYICNYKLLMLERAIASYLYEWIRS